MTNGCKYNWIFTELMALVVAGVLTNGCVDGAEDIADSGSERDLVSSGDVSISADANSSQDSGSVNIFECPTLWSRVQQDPAFVAEDLPETLAMFDETKVVEDFRIEFAEGEWDRMVAIWKDPKWADSENIPQWEKIKGDSYVHCSFTFNGETFDNAGCRLRGTPDNWADESKPQLKVKFNKWDHNARFMSMRAINLEFQNYNPAPIHNRLGYYLMRSAGIHSPRVAFARVYMDDVSKGLYEVIEVVDHEFLETHFADPEGVLWEGGYIKQTNEEDPETCDIDVLDDLVYSEPLGGNHDEFAAKLSQIMDVSQVLKVIAAEVVFPTTDNLSNGSTNYYFYNEPRWGFVAIPFDLDGLLDDSADPKADIWEYLAYSDEPSPLRRILNETPAWRQEYLANLAALNAGPYPDIKDEIDRVHKMIRDYLEDDEAWGTEYEIEDFDEYCEYMKTMVDQRTEYLNKVLQ